MSKEKSVKEIDVESLDAELAAARKLEENKNTVYGKIAAIFALTMSIFHILEGMGFQWLGAKMTFSIPASE